MDKLTFDEYRLLIESIPAPAQRIGIFSVKINNFNKRYYFEGLKTSAHSTENRCGLSLNHYGWLGLPKQRYNQSKFHDEEDVAIEILKDEFKYAYKVKNFNEIGLVMKTWTAQINW